MPEIDDENLSSINENKPTRKAFRWVRAFAAVAAVFVVVFFGSITAKAFGFDIWEAVIQWTQETFHFGVWGNSDSNNKLPYASLQEALLDDEITENLVPTWLPDKYQLADITITHSPQKCTYRATYVIGDDSLKITVQDYLGKIPVYVEQSEGLVEEYVVSGITYYLFADIDIVKAVWINGSFECYITGELTIEDLKQMIDSIEKG